MKKAKMIRARQWKISAVDVVDVFFAKYKPIFDQ